MRYAPNTVYPFQELKFGRRVIFFRILSVLYDSPDNRYREENDFKYINSDFDNVPDELLNTALRYLELGYCPAIDINESYPASGVTCLIHAKTMGDWENLY